MQQSAVRKTSVFFLGCYRLSFALLSLPEQLTLLRLFSAPDKRALLRKRPRIVFKYLHRYLFASARRIDRLAALTNHYKYLSGRTTPDFFTTLVNEKPCLWRQDSDDTRIEICLTFPYPADQEGDLGLQLVMNGKRLQIISFSIIPGGLIGEPDAQVLFVGRVQGLVDSEKIRHATKCCRDITPSALLMAALDGVTKAFGIRTIVGVGSREQLSTTHADTGDRLHFDYDHFWASLHAEKTAADFYRLASPMVHKALASVPSNHRKRTRLKRAYKAEVSDAVESYLRQHCLLPA
jgi:uncharacterized protein VirK/YbjX